MSEHDDRMERAERIRKMRQSREPDENDQGTNDDGGEGHDSGGAEVNDAVDDSRDAEDGGDADDSHDAGDGTAAGIAAADTVDGSPDVDDADSEETNDEKDHERETAGAKNPDDAGEPAAIETAERTPTDAAAGEVEDVTASETDDDPSEPEDTSSGASMSEVEAPSPDVTAQAARAEAAVTEIDATSSAPAPSAATAAEAASSSPTAGAVDSGAIAPLGDSAGFSLPGQDDGSEASTDEATDGVATGGAQARGSVTTATEPSVRVLEFTVGDQAYCIDIECVEEIVKRDAVTRVPNTEAYVEGVVDLRGQITTILDTKQLLDVDATGPENLLVIFAPDAFEEHGTVGWVVDEVRQVVPVMESQVRTAPSDEDYVRGVVDREDEDLVVWIRPGDAMDQAVAVGDDE